MAVEDYAEPEVAVAVAATAVVFSPPARRLLRRGLVYGLAGAMMIGDALSSVARGAVDAAQGAAQGAMDAAQTAGSAAADAAKGAADAASQTVDAAEGAVSDGGASGTATRTGRSRARTTTPPASEETPL